MTNKRKRLNSGLGASPFLGHDTCFFCLFVSFQAIIGSSQEEKGAAEDERVGWHHQLNGQEFEQDLADGEGQGSLACCSPWDCKELDATEQLNNK